MEFALLRVSVPASDSMAYWFPLIWSKIVSAIVLLSLTFTRPTGRVGSKDCDRKVKGRVRRQSRVAGKF